VLAHADIVERIADLDRAIAQHPNEWALYLKRGELHRLHRNWAAALEDYDRAERIATELPDIHFYRGRMWYEAGEPEAARAALDRFLTLRPNHVDALITRSRVLAELGNYLAGAKDLTRAIAVSKTPTPELYLERARHLAAAGPSYVSQALSGLDEAIALLGPLVTLINYAVELEVTHGRPVGALARLDLLPKRIAGQPHWLAWRGDLLMAAGKQEDAKEAYLAGLQAIERLPETRRKTRAMSALESKLRTGLHTANDLP
jgi:tetratricopeptide (TPR) repeat protein